MLTLFTLFTLFSSSLSISSFKYNSCGKPTDIAQNIVLDIDPILPQTDYTLFLNADFSKEVDKGTSKYTVTYNFIPLTPTVNDLCTEIASSNITCPLNNHISSESKGSIPNGLSGTTTIKNEWFNNASPEERILCMLFTIKT
jgi:hypothetical protein